MLELTPIENSLFASLYSRIYVSNHYPDIFYDEKAMALAHLLPQDASFDSSKHHRALIASAVGTYNMDCKIQDFIRHNPDAVIVQLGCGLDTSYFRNSTWHQTWYEIDTPSVIELRNKYIEPTSHDIAMAHDIFDLSWLDTIRQRFATEPILLAADKLLYLYSQDQVIDFLEKLSHYEGITLVCDAFTDKGCTESLSYVQPFMAEGQSMPFVVNDIEELSKQIGAKDVQEDSFFRHVDILDISWSMFFAMHKSDKQHQLKMITIKF